MFLGSNETPRYLFFLWAKIAVECALYILQCHNCALVMALPSSVRHYVGTLPVHKFDIFD